MKTVIKISKSGSTAVFIGDNLHSVNKPFIMEKLKLKPAIETQIVMFFDQFHPGEVFKSGQLVRYVNNRIGKRHYPDTILRYCRGLRKHDHINYTCVGGKASCQFKVLEIGEPHSL